jgi:hypothetical protein
MAAKNDVTGDSLRTRVSNDKYSEGWDRIFGKKDENKPKETEQTNSTQEVDKK